MTDGRGWGDEELRAGPLLAILDEEEEWDEEEDWDEDEDEDDDEEWDEEEDDDDWDDWDDEDTDLSRRRPGRPSWN